MKDEMPTLWSGTNGISIPANMNDPQGIVKFANPDFFPIKQQEQIVKAFNMEAYDMAAEFAWKKAMIKLKETLSTLGTKFLGEMLGRTDIDEFTPIDLVLTDYAAIQLAEQLGVVGKTAAFKLKQSLELISHYFSSKSDQEFDLIDAVSIVKSSVQYILGEQDISIAIEFSELRNRLLDEDIQNSDEQIKQLVNSPLFYIRTVLTILLTSIKKDKGAKLEHCMFNTNMLVPLVWKNLAEVDKWNIGTTYRDVVADGNSISANGLKRVLLKVAGFDYVPENLRSSTFKEIARRVIDIHFSFDNFYNEPSIVKALANLGSTIPAPAFTDCIQAYLVVYLGNNYGVSVAAAPIAEKELAKISKDRWRYYFEKILGKDEIILTNLKTQSQVTRFSNLLKNIDCDDFIDLPRDLQKLYESIIQIHVPAVRAITEKLYTKLNI
jgi:hypothetical protein